MAHYVFGGNGHTCDEASSGAQCSTLAVCRKILQNWCDQNIKSLADIAIEQQRFQARKQQVSPPYKGRRQEIIPKWFHQRYEEEPTSQQTIDFEAERQKY